MNAHPIDTEALRVRAEHVYRHGGPANAIESLAANMPEILDRLAAAEHRATRAEAQSAIRGRTVAIYRERAREAEARIKAVRDAAGIWDQGYRAGFSDGPFICACNAWSESECACGNYGNGETPEPNPYRASETA